MKIITIQPQEREDGVLPYPYHINGTTGEVGRQDFWKGNPMVLIGFNGSPDNETVEPACGLKAFLKRPKIAIGKYPIFEHKNGEWYTYKDKIDRIHIK